jgi:hypothetical protein
MSQTGPSLTDIVSMMAAAETEAVTMSKSHQNSGESHTETQQLDNSMPQIIGSEPAVNTSINSLPQIPGMNFPNNIGDIKDALNSTNLSSVLSKMSDNPGELGRVMTESMDHMTPSMRDQARKLAQGGQSDQIKREMVKLGMDPRSMQSMLKEQQRQQKSLDKLIGNVKISDERKVVLITASRQLKAKSVPSGSIKEFVAHSVHTDNPVELSCSRLAVGPLEGKIIKLWYDPNRKGKNPRSTKIIGFPIAGEAVIVADDYDLTEEMVSAAEKLLV